VAAGVAAVLAVGVGAGFAIGALTNDKQKKDVARASTSTTDTVPPVTAVAPTTTTPTVPTTPTSTDVPPATATPPTAPTTPTTPGVPPASTPPSTTPTTPSTPPATGGSGIAKWPAGTTAYTVVLISAATHKQANTKAREAKSRGIDAGVLHSNNFSSLNPGYWVVFAGQYSTANEARSHIGDYASKGFAGGYPRQVKK
jgi:hypothetical protein